MNEYDYGYNGIGVDNMGEYRNSMYDNYIKNMPGINYVNNMPSDSTYTTKIPSSYSKNISNTSYSSGMSSSSYIKNMPNINTYDNNISNTNLDNKILEPYNGFIRGNMFSDLYDKYKNYKPQDINPTSEKEALLNQWQQYNFALIDLGMYLDVYPNDKNALNLYKKYLDISKQITNKYESMYGPIYSDSEFAIKNKWNWDNSPWPWEVIK